MDSLQNLADVLASQARCASGNLRTLSEDSRKAVLFRTAELLREKKEEIFEKNRLDLENSKGKISDAMLDRLTLNDARLE
ncbi:MAG: glutamate-5-semialdehyde dehydrogenase, partial [Fibrobacteraceae bacterium]|nr:glutamate-5-semialdehyde dehydrogenase [Fibrobacteraceae bacterium]